jgi:hypothetical protein
MRRERTDPGLVFPFEPQRPSVALPPLDDCAEAESAEEGLERLHELPVLPDSPDGTDGAERERDEYWCAVYAVLQQLTSALAASELRNPCDLEAVLTAQGDLTCNACLPIAQWLFNDVPFPPVVYMHPPPHR